MKNYSSEILCIICGIILACYGTINLFNDNKDIGLIQLTLTIIMLKLYNLKFELKE